jgi:hypothetical protein
MLVARSHGSSVFGLKSASRKRSRDTYQARLWCQQNEGQAEVFGFLIMISAGA